ncbi:hypothetical protein D3C72_698250 [compost metagenome]
MLGLVDGVLAGTGVKHQQHFVRCVGVELADHPANLFQLFHQVVFGVQAAGGVGDQYIDATGLGGLHSVEYHRGRVGASMLGDHRDLVALAPDLQLLYRRRTEGVAGGEHDFLAFQLQFLRQLADGGGLAGTVDADDQNHERLVLRGDFQWLLDGFEHGRQLGLQGFVQGIGVSQFLARNLLRQTLNDHRGGFDTDVGSQQTGLEVLEQFVINNLFAQEQAGHAFADTGAGLGQALLEAGEETGFGFFGAYRLDRGFDGRRDRLRNRSGCRCLSNRSNRSNRSIEYRNLWLADNGNRLGHDDGFNNRFDHRRMNRCRRKRCRGRNRRGHVGGQVIFDKRHGFFGYRQGQPRFGCRSQRLLGDNFAYGFGSGFNLGLQQRLGNRQNNRRGRFFYYRNRRRCWLRNGLWLFDDGFLRLFAQPSEQAFLLASRSWGLLVVVGTKHGGRLSHGSDAPMAPRQINIRCRTDCD